MGKIQLSILLIFISTVGYNQTNISGGIFQNTTWSLSGNPYIATGDVVVFEDVILTLEPGVIVKFNSGASLEIRGKLIAIGNSSDSIRFTSNSSSPAMNSWKGIIVKGTNNQTGNGNQVSMEYCIGEYAGYFIDLNIAYEGPYVFKHCYFGHNFQTNDDGGLPETIFDHCRFVSNNQAVGGSSYTLNVINCEFVNNKNGVDGVDLVDSCYFSNTTEAAVLSNEIVSNCTIVNNNIGVDCYFAGSRKFVNNVVQYNNIGVSMQKYFTGHNEFTGNTICNNSVYNLELLDFNNASIPFNCWCSEDSAFIRSTIFDGFVNTNYGLVAFTPIEDDCSETNVGIESEYRGNDGLLDIFPNPFIDELSVRLSTSEEVEIILYDLNANQLLRQRGINIVSLNTTYLPAGIFILEIKTKDRQLDFRRVVKVE